MSELQKVDVPAKKVVVSTPVKRKPIRKFFKLFVDVKKWVSYEEISANAKTTLGLFRRLFHLSSGEERHQETYEEAVVRMGLNEVQLSARKKNFLHSAIIYAIFTIGLFSYFIHLLVNWRLLAAFITLMLVVLTALVTYREHFWYMQMKKKKLGCNFYGWLAFILGRNG